MTFIEHRQQEYVGEPKIKLLSLVGDMDVMTPFRKQANTGQSPRQLRLETLGAGTGCTAACWLELRAVNEFSQFPLCLKGVETR